MDYFEQIDDYLNDKLSNEEKQAFEHEMNQNESLKKAVEDHPVAKEVIDRLLEADIRATVEAHNSVNETEEFIKADTQPGIRNQTNRTSQWIIGVAAVIVVIYGFYRFMQPTVNLVSTPETRVASVYSAPVWPTVRGENDTLSSIIDLYQSGQKTSAKQALLLIDSDDSKYWLSELYLSEYKGDSTLMYLPDYNSAVTQQKRDRLYFNRVLATVLTNNYKDAQKMIANAPENMDEYYKERLASVLTGY